MILVLIILDDKIIDFLDTTVIINNMIRIIVLFLVALLSMFNLAFADNTKILSAGVSINDVPKALFGTWRVSAKLEDSNSYKTFKPQSVDVWNLSRIGDTLTLSNQFTGAKAEISIKAIEGNLVVFTKKAPYNNKVLTDTVSIRLDKNNFKGINTLALETLSDIDGHVIKTENAKYIITGEKIAGENAIE